MDSIRVAKASDIDAMVDLSEVKRSEYATYQPLFWRKAQDSAEHQIKYFHRLLDQQSMIMLVHTTDGQLDGFIIASIVPAPPVYDICGLNCLVDDFCVRDETTWSNVGQQLLSETLKVAKTKGAVQVVIVNGHHHAQKRKFLQDAGLSLASEWYTSAIDKIMSEIE